MEGTRGSAERARRVAITSMGAVCALGDGVGPFWEGLLTGRSGVGQVTRFDTARYHARAAAEVVGFAPDAGNRREDRAHVLGVQAANEALRGSGEILEGRRGAVVVGTTMGANGQFMEWLGREPARGLFQRDANLFSVANLLSSRTGARGPSLTVSVACASGTVAIGLGADLIRKGEADAVLAGGVDVFSEFVFAGFDSLRALSPSSVRPFDARRDGLALGEGAAFVLLEELRSARARGKAPLALVAGYGSAGDAHHMTRPSPSGEGLVRAVRAALKDADISPHDVGFVSSHGTGTVFNDRMEAAAFRTLFGGALADLPVNSIKGAVGHTLGAAGALEAVMSALVLGQGAVPPTAGHGILDPECVLDVVSGEPREFARSRRYVLSTSSAFAGTNAALVLERA